VFSSEQVVQQAVLGVSCSWHRQQASTPSCAPGHPQDMLLLLLAPFSWDTAARHAQDFATAIMQVLLIALSQYGWHAI
jgi:hypothetical protein